MGIDRAIWSVINCIRKILIRRSAGSFYEPALFLLAKKEAGIKRNAPESRLLARSHEEEGSNMRQQIIYQDLSLIHPYEKNPRKNDGAVAAVAESIQEFGFKVPVIVDRNNVIIAGHTRYKAALQLGLDQIPCIVAEDLNDEQIKAYRIADNKVSEAAAWDGELLRGELEQLQAMGYDLAQTGVEEFELDSILRDIQDTDFEDFFVESIERPAKEETTAQTGTARQGEAPAQTSTETPVEPSSRSRIQCPHCGGWIEQ